MILYQLRINLKKTTNLLIGEDSISLGEKGGSISPLDTSYEKVEYVVKNNNQQKNISYLFSYFMEVINLKII